MAAAASSMETICGRICAVSLEAINNELWKGEFNIADTHIQTIRESLLLQKWTVSYDFAFI